MPFLTETDPSLQTALRLANLTCLAYQLEDRIAEQLTQLGYTQLALFDKHFGFVADSGEEIVIVFRGTSDVADWITNVDATLWPGYGGGVHRGFATLADQVWPTVLTLMRDSSKEGRRVWATGHSRGGALATLTARRLQSAGIPVGVCTFGAPRVGDSDFVQNFRPRVHYRVENFRDPVPFLPLRGYDWTGTRLFLQPSGFAYAADGSLMDRVVFACEKIAILAQLSPMLKDPVRLAQFLASYHGMDRYLAALSDVAV